MRKFLTGLAAAALAIAACTAVTASAAPATTYTVTVAHCHGLPATSTTYGTLAKADTGQVRAVYDAARLTNSVRSVRLYQSNTTTATTIHLTTLGCDNRVSYPPFWHHNPPRWCQEDMTCWIGTTSDSRTDKSSLADWDYQMRHTGAINH